MKTRVPSLIATLLALTGCPSDPPNNQDLSGAQDMAMQGGGDMTGGGAVLSRPSKSSTVAISDDESVVVMTNADDGTVSIFNVASGTRTAQVQTGEEPWAVVIHPDKTTAFVTNRAAASVVRITGINTATPQISAPVLVGSEPVGLALSPTGAKLFVSEWGEGRVSVIDTAKMMVIGSMKVDTPRGLLVTNNLDNQDNDETVVVTQFYGTPRAGGEAKDDGRTGVVKLFSAADYSDKGTINFSPLTAAEAGFTVATAPNQLFAVAQAGKKIYVPSVSASPQGPPKFDNNVNPVVYVADLDTKAEVKTGTAGTVNLAREVNKAIPDGNPRHFLADLRDIDFVPGSGVAYFVAQGADVLQRVSFSADGAITEFGSTQNKQIDVLGSAATGVCQGPNGIAIAGKAQKAFLNCSISRRLGIVNLANQALDKAVESTTIPAAQQVVQRGKRFFFTGRARWSRESWSSCGSCHPDGLSDNITWIFAAGPRQTTSMDGSYSHGPGAQKQRIFNWSAIIDEMHDFEANTRGTSGGLGAITNAPAQGDCGTLAKEVRVGTDAMGTLPAPLGAPTAKELQDGTTGLPAGVRCTKDWDEIDAYAKTIRPPRGRKLLDSASVARGAALFASAQCTRCHGGSGWTVSRRFYEPSSATNMRLASMVAFAKPAMWPASYTSHSTFQIATQPASAETGAFAMAIAPPQLACAIRNVGTFGVPNDTAATDALEIKAAGAAPANRAQGRGGYNAPSLYGMTLGAPYLHHGQAATLDELFKDAKWANHTRAGNANFLTGASADQERADLINFLWSIDATTTEQAIPAGFDAGCAM